jgi:crotonobetainyl-CoA:carnitine CoA-transferase CaiB-like acyl-CoA transferase
VIKANRVPTGNLGQTAAPADIYRTKDGWVLCQVTGHPLFIRWARLMGEEDQWLSDPRFADDIKRGDNGPVVSDRMARWCAERTTQEAVDTLGGAMIPAGPVPQPATGAGSSAYSCHRLHAGCRLSGLADTCTGRTGCRPAVGNAR